MMHSRPKGRYRVSRDALADVESHEEMLTITEAMTEAAREGVVVEFTDEFPLDTSLE